MTKDHLRPEKPEGPKLGKQKPGKRKPGKFEGPKPGKHNPPHVPPPSDADY